MPRKKICIICSNIAYDFIVHSDFIPSLAELTKNLQNLPPYLLHLGIEFNFRAEIK